MRKTLIEIKIYLKKIERKIRLNEMGFRRLYYIIKILNYTDIYFILFYLLFLRRRK